jgi:superfamily II DNA or RNA helicase
MGLWPHQSAAVEMIQRFLTAQRGRKGPSALVRMPTGTGKSGVIAVAAQHLVTSGDVLLLTPWDALVRQLQADVGSRFWNKIGEPIPMGKDLVRIYPSTAREELASHRGKVIWLATIATLQTLHQTRTMEYEEFRKRLRMVVVDEGHYEPARSWSEAVRGLGRPTVLFSATPYRNDVKYFELSEEYQSHFSHAEAESTHILRKVQFEPVSFDGIPEFCDRVIGAVESRFGSDTSARVIVRCDSPAEINQVIDTLSQRGHSVLGIHETFPVHDSMRLRHVPNPDERSERFWVHQFKLTEGIDSAAFKGVAFFRPLPSERAFVQQVGRVLRNPTRSATEFGLVIYSKNDSLDAAWEAYRAYDNAAAETGLPASPLEIATWQPPPQYFDRRFRDSFDIRKEVEPRDLLFPRSVRVFQAPESFDLDDFATTVELHLEDSDCLHHRVTSPRSDMRLHPYMMINNSPILSRSAFYQCSLGFTCYRRIGSYLFYLDSEGLHPDSLAAMNPVDTSCMRRLYHGVNVRLGSIALSNTNLGPSAARRRTIHARSIGDLGPDLSDHAQLATTVTGSFQVMDGDGNPQYVSRYVGFSRSRISDRGMVEFDEYNAWLEELARSLDDSNVRPLHVFSRFAQVIQRPADPTPRNILLDFDPGDFLDGQDVPGGRLRVEDLCVDVTDGHFKLTANDDIFEVSIKWDAKSGRYLLTCPDLDKRFSIAATSSGHRAVSLVSYMNREQAFRVIPESAGEGEYCIYTGRRFYRPRLPLGPSAHSDNPDLLELMQGVEQFGNIAREKGAPGSATSAGWASDSLFGFIDSRGAGSFLKDDMKFDLLICDDMGTEIADFIGLDSANRRVVAIHAKAFSSAKRISASALQEVSAQALKNLGFLQPYPYGKPPNLNRWGGAWNGPAGRVSSRVRQGSGTPSEMWKRIRDTLVDPRATREVWIMLGQGPPQSLLRTESHKRPPRAEAIQMLFSLQATWSAVTSTGARLRVFSSL